MPSVIARIATINAGNMPVTSAGGLECRGACDIFAGSSSVEWLLEFKKPKQNCSS